MVKTSNLFNKTLVVGVIVLFLGVSFQPVFAFDNVKKSSIPFSDGNILYVGGNGTGNYTRIQDAVDNATDSDTVFVYDDSSPYYENVIVNKSIKLIGENRETTVINGSLNQSLSTVYILSENVTLSGFTFQKYLINNYTNDNVIEIQSDYNIISGNILTGNKTIGIQIEDSHYNNISSNVFTSNLDLGIFLYHSNYTNISNNYFSGVFVGICLQYYSNNNDITNNFISYCGAGLYLLFTRNNFIYGNIITNNQIGISSESFSINNKIIGNNISYNKLGLFIMSPLEDEVTQNNFIANNESAYFFYDIYFGLRAKHFLGIKPYIPKIFWNSNYWDEPRLQSYFIPGFITFFSFNFLIRYFFRFYIKDSEQELFPFPINWFNMDKHPAKEPYEILP